MAEYGLTPAGLVIKNLSTIIEEKKEEVRAFVGDTANVESESVFGQLINISAEREYELWLLLEQIYNAQYPSTAEDGALDQAVSLNGIVRDGIIYSRIFDQAFWGTPGTVIPAGTIIRVPNNSTAKYTTNDGLTLGAGTNQIQSLTFSTPPTLGDWTVSFKGETSPTTLDSSTNATALKDALELIPTIDEVTVSGDMTSGFTVEFIGDLVKFRKNPELVIVTNTLNDGSNPVSITVSITTSGVYQAIGKMTAVEGGAAPFAYQETLTEFENTPTGVDKTLNESPSTKGADRESDSALKIRRNKSLSAFGGGTTNAIEAAILDINEIATCRVYENDLITTDSYGRPGKSFETFVRQKLETEGGSPDPDIDQKVANLILYNKPAGIQTVGSEGPFFVTDAGGFEKKVFFSRPVAIPIFLTWKLTTESAVFPVGGETSIGEAVVEYGNTLGQGVDVIVYPYLMEVLNEFEGIVDVETDIGITSSPSGDENVKIDDGTSGAVQVSSWSSENIIIINNNITYTYNPSTGKWES